MRKDYDPPRIVTERCFESCALACGKASDQEPGTWHFTGAYDTFTGHWAGGFGGSESVSGTAALGFGGGGNSMTYPLWGLCGNWVTYSS